MNNENIGRRLGDALNGIKPKDTPDNEAWQKLHELHYDAMTVINRQNDQISKLSRQLENALKTMRITGELAERQLRALSDAQYHFPEMEKFDIEDLRDQVREHERNAATENEEEPSGPRM